MWVNDVARTPPQKCGLLSFSKIPLCIHESTFLWVERERGVHILLFLGYFFAQRNFDSWSFIDRIDLHPKKKMTTFFPICSTFFGEKVLVGVYVFNNSLYRTIKGLLMAKKDSECLDQGQGCKFVFLTFG